jgi:hypothetical protein
MAKDGKKAGKAKLPKKVGGVKLPKKLRKVGKKALKLAQEPVVSETVAAALLAAAAALREGPAVKRSAKAAGAAALNGAEEAGREANKLADSLRSFAIDMARRTLDSWDEKGASGGPKTRGGASDEG